MRSVHANRKSSMKRGVLILIVLVVAALAGGAVMLANMDLPVEREPVAKVLPDDRFPR